MRPPPCLAFAVLAALTTLSLTSKMPVHLQLHKCMAYYTFCFVYPYFRVCVYIVRLQLYSSRNGNWDFVNYVQGVYPSRKTIN